MMEYKNGGMTEEPMKTMLGAPAGFNPGAQDSPTEDFRKRVKKSIPDLDQAVERSLKKAISGSRKGAAAGKAAGRKKFKTDKKFRA
jgi:hypothetical protein